MAPRLVPLPRWSLRARLLAALVGLLAVVCLAVGAASTLALRAFLVDRLDTQLQQAGGRSAGVVGRPDGRGPRGGDRTGARFVLAPGQGPGTLGARLEGGQVTAVAVLTPDGTLRDVGGEDTRALGGLSPGDPPRTVTVPQVGDFRALATRAANGDVLVTGLPMEDVDDTVLWLVGLQSAVAGTALLAAAGAGAVIVRRTLQPLHRVAVVATQVTALPLARGEVELAARVPEPDTDPRTEVGRVGSALNQLLDHVGAALQARHASETRVRQFVADASHELRTPLAAIRGYAELTRRSPQPVPPDVAHALVRVESEAQRMTGLVEDLLLLARLDSGRPLDHAPVDLTRLLVDTVSDASATGPDHAWRLELPDEPVEVLGDQPRLHQVLANLLANARTHTPPGTTVTAGLTTRSPGQAVVVVRDDGPGVPAALLPHVFSRFARGDGSRTRGAGSTGLGLAIVEAIVQAHGGTVAVSSRPGATEFVVRLPAVGGGGGGTEATGALPVLPPASSSVRLA